MTTNTEIPKFNIELHNRIITQIEADPACFNQTKWHCGSAHCYGGWAQILSGKAPSDATVVRDARVALGLSQYEAAVAFSAKNTLEFLRNLPSYLKYDRDGYNRADYDRDGYDRDGYNRAGYDRDGYDRDGYDRDGYNRADYDRDGYDRDGLDKFNNVRQS